VLLLLLASAGCAVAADPAPLADAALAQIQALADEKSSRTPAQRKMDSQLVYAARQIQGLSIAAAAPAIEIDVRYAADGRVLLDIDAEVTAGLLAAIEQAGGTVVCSVPRFRAVRALVRPERIEELAGRADVSFVRRADEAQTNTGSLTTEGDAAHAAPLARRVFGATGAGVRVGVLSDSVDYLSNSQAWQDLGDVTVLPGQAGTNGTGEGTAMLEIVHDLAPDAELCFATAFISAASFTQNILDLRASGCDIIMDDVTYFSESPFQDGIIAQSVNTVVTNGALYFSSAGNSGSKTQGTSGTWEGDFADGGAAGGLYAKGGRLHNFGGSNYNAAVAGGSSYRVNLFWSDPLGASTNDYDVYVLNAAGTAVLRSSTTTQNGTQDPYESLTALNAGERVVIVKASGAARYIHLNTGRGRLAINTAGNTHGHNAAARGFCVAAVSAVSNAAPGAFGGGAANPVETFSSDGPRRMFYNQDGTPVTPGNFLSTGGVLLRKPDLAAADGGKCSVPTFNGFYGTSAAVPHAAAVAALIWSRQRSLSDAQVSAALTNTALDIMGPGVDRDSGAGIVMAPQALASVVPGPDLALFSATLGDGPPGNGNGELDPGETVRETLVVTNLGVETATGVTSALSTAAAGVTILQGTSSHASLLPGRSATNDTPLSYQLSPAVTAGTSIVFQHVVACDGASRTGTFSRLVGHYVLRTNTFYSAYVPRAIIDEKTTLVTNLVATGAPDTIDDVDVLIRINHTYDADMAVVAHHPDGTSVMLSGHRGGSSANFGNAGTATLFDDGAPTPVASGTAPFIAAGGYRPDGVLGDFNGKPLNGAWRLRVYDAYAGDMGSVTGFALRVVSHRSAVAAPINRPPVASNQSLTVITGVLTGFVLRAGDPDGDPLTFRTNSLPAHGVLSGFDTNSGAIAYTAAGDYDGPDSFTFSVRDGATNSPAATVSLAVVRPSLAVALDNTGVTWTVSGSTGWVGQAAVTHDGTDAARSGVIGHRQTSTLRTEVVGAGSLTFWWKVSSEADYDWLCFLVDAAIWRAISGEAGWAQVSVRIEGSGLHVLEWQYRKDKSDTAGADRGWLDEAVWTPDAPSANGFVLWMQSKGLTGDPVLQFAADRNADGLQNGFEYALGTNATPGVVLLRLGGRPGIPVADVPRQDSNTAAFVDFRVECSSNLLAGRQDWTVPVGHATNDAARPPDRDWFEPLIPLREAFYRVRAALR
jgi:subtilisin-like proprotein convertase family protein